MAFIAAAKEAQQAKIYDALPSWIDPLICTVSPFPASGEEMGYWVATFRCPCSAGGGCHPQRKVCWKKYSTQDGIAAEMAQKIEAAHGRHHTHPT